MGRVSCFIVVDTKREQQKLRRYSHTNANCGGRSYHNAEVLYIEDTPAILSPEGYRESPAQPPRDDPRWPTKCDHCDYVFKPEDNWQVFCTPWYARPETSERWLMRQLPPGAMYEAWWMGDTWRGPDGKTWIVILPDGNEWCIDGPSSSGGRWKRTGTAPNFTANPSILTKKYHGWLRDGVLTPC